MRERVHTLSWEWKEKLPDTPTGQRDMYRLLYRGKVIAEFPATDLCFSYRPHTDFIDSAALEIARDLGLDVDHKDLWDGKG